MKPCSKILIADDDPTSRQLLAGLLDDTDYQLVFAADGDDALAKAGETKPDLLLLDVVMPKLDGFEVCRKIRLDPALAELPIVVLTSLDDRSSRLRALEAGADDFLTKPYDALELLARVKTITRINRYRWLSNERLKFDWVVRNADDGYLMVGLDGRVSFANERARSWLGLPAAEEAAEMTGFLEAARRLYRLEPDEVWQVWEEAIASQPKTPRFFVRPESAREQGLWLRVDLLELTAGLQGSRLVRLRDFTGQMRDRQDLWTLRRALCHKLRTPLIGLVGCLDMLAASDEMPMGGEIAELAGMASTSAHRLDGSVTDLLQYLGAGDMDRGESAFALGNLPALVAQIGAEMKLAPPRLDMPGEVAGQSITMAGRGFEVVLRELMENAQKFHPAHTPAVAVTVALAKGSRIKLTVCDDGINLSPQELSRVWLPGYQAEKRFTGEVPGMGMGLSMVASILWQNGGSCRLRNRDDGSAGICAELFFPLTTHAKP